MSATAPVNLWFDQTVPPNSTNATDYALLTSTTNGFNTLNTNGPPPLMPGTTYYLGVQNTNATAVTFSIQVDFDVTPLTNASPIVSPSGPYQRYFSFDVGSNITGVTFQLTNLAGNLDMVVRKGLPFPDLASFDYGSFNPGRVDEVINIFTNSDPFPLGPGRYYIGVFNRGAGIPNYTIVATQTTNAVPKIITLFNKIPYSNTNSGVSPAIDYYRYVVSTNAARVQFEVNGSTADVTLVAKRSLPLPDNSSYDYRSANPGTNDELITMITNSSPVKLAPGEWFVSVVNNTSNSAVYTITATEFNVPGTNPVIVGYKIQGGSLCITWTSVPGIDYYVEGNTSVNTTNWVPVSPTITAVSNLTTYCIPFPTPYQFFRIKEGLAPAAAPPPAPPTISSITVTPSGRLLSWVAPTNETFNVQWTPSIVPATWNTFTNVISSTTGNFSFLDDGSQTGGNLGASRYYRLLVLP
jgi:hypothetical protein